MLFIECWKFEENKRPDIKQVVSTLKEIIFSNSNNEKEEIYLTAEEISNFELSKTSINSITDENDDLIIENIPSIINSKSNVNSQDNFLNESEGMAQPNYCHSYETKVINKCVTQNNSYKNCESIDSEVKEISNKAELIPCKKLAGKGYLGAKFNFRFGFIFSTVCNSFYIKDDDNRIFSGCQQKFEENYLKIQVFPILNKEMIFPEKLNNVKEKSYLTVGGKPNLELRKKQSINALNFNVIVPENNDNSTLHNHSVYFNVLNILLEESTQLDINENKENKIAQINPNNLNKNCGYMENEFKKVPSLFNMAVKYCDKKLYIKAFKLCKKLADKVNYWYHKAAAEDDNEVALYKLGEFYELGKGVCKNKVRAFTFYKQAAEKGYKKGRYKLGYCYEKGIGTYIDSEKADKITAKEENIDVLENEIYNQKQSIGKFKMAINWYIKATNILSTIW
ncbi:unnamed protein product [Rhizophagus irregularis]|nr:unnamed protein product [Rhizophagus irregularis]CAB5197286.1 unnamed protein product [Rhizophagus irregularis]